MKIFSSAKIIGENIDPSAYLRQESKRGDKDFIMSRSQLMEFALNPRRWLAGYGASDDDTKSTEFGNLMDCLVLTPNEFEKRFSVCPATYPDSKTGEPKDWTFAANFCKDWKKNQNGKTIVKDSESMDAILAVKNLRSDGDISELIDCSKKQVMIMGEYKDQSTGLTIPVKALLDLVPDYKNKRFGEYLGDYKTSRSSNPMEWQKMVYHHNYDAQAALFFDLYNAATGERRLEWFHIVQENVFPFEVLSPIPVLSADYLDIGRMKYLNALRLYARCLDLNEWPSYAPSRLSFNGFQIIEHAEWMISKQKENWPEMPKLQPTIIELKELMP